MSNDEQVVLVDPQGQALRYGQQIVSMPKLEAHQKGFRHLAVSVFIFNPRGQLLLQQRALSKYHSPGKWSNTCCTHPKIQETPIAAAQRRLVEEMGIRAEIDEVFTLAYRAEVGEGLVENEFDHIFIGQSEVKPNPDPLEVSSWEWISMPQLEHDMRLNPSKYTVWFRILWLELKKYLPSG
jgi:isopentenyl-diphosphate delta-isomerase